MATKQELEAAIEAEADARKLAGAQEMEVERMRAAGVDTEHAERLLDALRAGAQSVAVAGARKLSLRALTNG